MKAVNKFFKSNKHTSWIFFLGLLTYLLVISFQGFDVCDEGFVLTFYQNVFNNPEYVEYQFMYYLSGLLGGLLYKLTGNGEMIYFRLATVSVMFANSLLVYYTLRNWSNKYILYLSLCAVNLSFTWGVIVLHHNAITSLFILVAILILVNGITGKNRYAVFVSGVILGASVFLRLPNITLFIAIMLLVIPLLSKGYRCNFNLRHIYFYLIGYFSGIFLILSMMYILGHEEIFYKSFVGLFEKSQSAESSHSLTTLFNVCCVQLISAIFRNK